MWKTGHSHIKSKMKEVGAPIAGERSGHIFLKEGWFGFDDGVFAGLRLAEFVAQAGKPLSTLLAEAPPYVTSPEIHVDCGDEVKYGVVDRLTAEFQRDVPGRVNTINGARVSFPDGWGLVRASSEPARAGPRLRGQDAGGDGPHQGRVPRAARAPPRGGGHVAQRVTGGASKGVRLPPGLAHGVERVAGAAIRAIARASRPRPRAVRVEGLTAQTTVRFDAHGVPHVRAASEADAFRALGACHGLDRFFQMDMTRRLLSGGLCEVVGERPLGDRALPPLSKGTTLDADRLMRTLDLVGAAKRVLAGASADEVALLEAYCAGVNAVAAKLGARTSIEYRLMRLAVKPFRPLDCCLVAKGLALGLSFKWRAGPVFTAIAQALAGKPAHLAAILPPRARRPRADDRAARGGADARARAGPLVPGLGRAGRREQLVRRRGRAQSPSGFPIVANDPHLELSLPPVWYLASVSGGAYAAVGATLPRRPGRRRRPVADRRVGRHERDARRRRPLVGGDRRDRHALPRRRRLARPRGRDAGDPPTGPGAVPLPAAPHAPRAAALRRAARVRGARAVAAPDAARDDARHAGVPPARPRADRRRRRARDRGLRLAGAEPRRGPRRRGSRGTASWGGCRCGRAASPRCPATARRPPPTGPARSRPSGCPRSASTGWAASSRRTTRTPGRSTRTTSRTSTSRGIAPRGCATCSRAARASRRTTSRRCRWTSTASRPTRSAAPSCSRARTRSGPPVRRRCRCSTACSRRRATSRRARWGRRCSTSRTTTSRGASSDATSTSS